MLPLPAFSSNFERNSTVAAMADQWTIKVKIQSHFAEVTIVISEMTIVMYYDCVLAED